MFLQLSQEKKVVHEFNGVRYEITIYRAHERGELHGILSAQGYTDIVSKFSDPDDFKTTTGADPVEELILMIKSEINSGKLRLTK
jgi:hypothetical protein